MEGWTLGWGRESCGSVMWACSLEANHGPGVLVDWQPLEAHTEAFEQICL